MRVVVWLVLLFAVAVVAALTLGDNDGLVSFFWGSRRVDVSLNFFVLAALALGFVLVSLLRALDALLSLPTRAAAWRNRKREQAAQAALRESLAEYFAARYSRAHKAAQRAVEIQAGGGELAADHVFGVLAHLLAAGSLHKLQDRPRRDETLRSALRAARKAGSGNAVADGARLLGAEWALDDRDAAKADTLLAELPAGVARRTHALRLKLQAQRMGRHSGEALSMARMLAKHQAFSAAAAQSLLRSLAFEVIEGAHDIDQLRRGWQLFDASDRRDAFVVARAARRAARLGATDDARQWLRPLWDDIASFGPDERHELALALMEAADGIGAEWLPRLEAVQQDYPTDSAVQAAVGSVFAQRGLWGKAKRPLESAVADAELDARARRSAWRRLAELARNEGDNEGAARCDQAAAAID